MKNFLHQYWPILLPLTMLVLVAVPAALELGAAAVLIAILVLWLLEQLGKALRRAGDATTPPPATPEAFPTER